MFQLACELEKKLLGLPKDEHLPLMQYCHALVIKALTRIFFGDYFKDEGNILKFRHSFEIVSLQRIHSSNGCLALTTCYSVTYRMIFIELGWLWFLY